MNIHVCVCVCVCTFTAAVQRCHDNRPGACVLIIGLRHHLALWLAETPLLATQDGRTSVTKYSRVKNSRQSLFACYSRPFEVCRYGRLLWNASVFFFFFFIKLISVKTALVWHWEITNIILLSLTLGPPRRRRICTFWGIVVLIRRRKLSWVTCNMTQKHDVT